MSWIWSGRFARKGMETTNASDVGYQCTDFYDSFSRNLKGLLQTAGSAEKFRIVFYFSSCHYLEYFVKYKCKYMGYQKGESAAVYELYGISEFKSVG